jgi:hypothetical protein
VHPQNTKKCGGFAMAAAAKKGAIQFGLVYILVSMYTTVKIGCH